MEEAEKLADIATKLERFRYNVIASLMWAMFGMVFGSAMLFAGAMQLIGITERTIYPAMLIVAGVISGLLSTRFERFIPLEKSIRKRWHLGLLLMFIPFIISYALLPQILILGAFYFSIVWYPSLGAGLLLYGIYVERNSQLVVRNLTFSGALMLLTSIVLIPLSRLEINDQIILGSNLLTISMMIAIYLAASLRGFFGAQKVIQE
ncbi:hypothetical protein DRP07_09550 [Archaeoglobales archaeon]|nr:MAG: hypothetical protein DRP07_09550 [Archaeoglobales archaeon]